MAHFIVTLKVPTSFHNPHDKKTGACNFSPMCTDKTGAHHSVVVEADTTDEIHRWAMDTDIHITRIEEIFFVKKLAEVLNAAVPLGGLVGGGSAQPGDASTGSPVDASGRGVTTFDYAARARSLVQLPGDIGTAFHAALEIEEDRRRRGPAGD